MKKYQIIFLLLGIAGLVVMACQVDISAVQWEDVFLKRAPWILAIQLFIWLLIFIVHTMVYRETLGEDSGKIGFPVLLKIAVTGFALNNVTPAGLVGGEPYRILELKPYVGIKRASSATLIFSIFYVMGHVCLWLTGSVLYFIIGCPGGVVPSVGMGVAGVFCIVVLILFFRSKKKGFVVPLIKFGTKIPLLKKIFIKLLDKNGELYQTIDDDIREFRKTPKNFWFALGLEYLTRILESAEYFVILFCLGVPLNIFHGIIVLTLASLIGNIVFIIPMQAGTREGGMAMFLNWIGVASPIILMAGLLYRIRELICNAVGIICILIQRKVSKNTVSEAVPENTDSTESTGSDM